MIKYLLCVFFTSLCSLQAYHKDNPIYNYSELSLSGVSYGNGDSQEKAYSAAINKVPAGAKVTKVKYDKVGILYRCTINWSK